MPNGLPQYPGVAVMPKRKWGGRRVSLIASGLIFSLTVTILLISALNPSSDAVSAVTCLPAQLESCLVAMPASASTYVAPKDYWGSQVAVSTSAYVAHYTEAGQSQTATAANLSTAGIQQIVHRTWTAADGNQIDLVVLLFSSPQGARSHALQLNGTFLKDSEGISGSTIAVPGDSAYSAYRSWTPSGEGGPQINYATTVGDMVLEARYVGGDSSSTSDFTNWVSAELTSLHSAPPVPAATPPAPAAETVTCVTSLAACLMPQPKGTDPWVDSWSANPAAPTEAEFVSHFYQSDAVARVTAQLNDAGLTALARRSWSPANSQQGDEVLLNFSSANGALAWYDNITASETGTEFAIPGQNSAEGFTLSGDADGYVQSELFGLSGSTVMQMFFFHHGSAGTADAAQVASTQLQLISAHGSQITAPVPAAPTLPVYVAGQGDSSACAGGIDGCLPTAPEGAVPWSSDAYDATTDVTAQQFIAKHYSTSSADEQAFEVSLLQDFQIKSVAHRDWRGSDATQVDVSVMSFASAAMAEANAWSYQGAVVTGGTVFAVPGVPNAVGQFEPMDKLGNVYIQIIVAEGAYEVRLDFYSPVTANIAEAVKTFDQVYALLPQS